MNFKKLEKCTGIYLLPLSMMDIFVWGLKLRFYTPEQVPAADL